jgi:hypothetical protein
MKRATFMLALLPLAGVAQRHDRELQDWRVKDQEAIKRSFDVTSGSGPAKLLVDNISGFVHVTGYSGREVQVSVQKHIGADSNEAMAEAKRDVKLDMSQQGNYVRLYVDGPFRDRNGVNYRGDNYYGYRVILDYEIQVPAATELILKTINNGEIEVKKTTGDFEIDGLNGGIDMEEISGSGKIRTLNGPVKVAFSRNPTKNVEFRTLNGKMDVYFQPGLNADLNFHTLNGGIYSDFDITTRPSRTSASGENVNGKFVYRSDRRSMEARAGSGGPELSFNALNGTIRLHSKSF